MNCNLVQEASSIKKLIFSCLVLSSFPVFGMTYINHANSQFAGEVGLLSMGLGKHFTRYSIGGMYGFVPAELSGGPAIETVAVRQTFDFYFWKRLTFYGGLNVFHVLGVKYKTSEYGKAPKSYYPIGAVRGLLNIGGEFDLDSRREQHFYFEAGLNDIALTNIVSNADSTNVMDEISLGFGFKQDF